MTAMTKLYKAHGKSVGWWQCEARETESGAELYITFSKTEDGAVVEKFAPVKGKNIGRANETTPLQQAVSELESRVNKQLDKGYVRTREEANLPVTNTLGRKKPMLATPFAKIKEDEIDWATAYIQPKLNGNRGMKDDILYSRPGKEFKNLDHLVEAITGTPLDDLHLDGEIYVHNGTHLQTIGSWIKKKQPETLTLEYWLYDIMVDLPFKERYAALAKAYNESKPLDPRIKLTPTLKVNNMAEARQAHEQNLKDGFEGSIIRWGDDGYEDDVRSRGVVKWKPFEDHEFKVIGYEWGTPNRDSDGNELLVPVFIYEIPGCAKTGKVTGPGDMYQKDKDGREVETLMGRMMTIEHMGYTKDGVPDIATAKCWKEEDF